jgi:biopolymer transport protein ExbD
MKRRAQGYEEEKGVDINLSPLIDCVFLLLIFFIVTTVFVEETGLEVQKPRAVSASELEKRSVMIALGKDGRIVYDGRQLDLNSLRGVVARRLRAEDLPVIIIADRESLSGRLVEVIDECKLAGARQVSIAADSARDPGGGI